MLEPIRIDHRAHRDRIPQPRHKGGGLEGDLDAVLVQQRLLVAVQQQASLWPVQRRRRVEAEAFGGARRVLRLRVWPRVCARELQGRLPSTAARAARAACRATCTKASVPFAGRFAAFAAALNDVAAIAHDGSAISTRSSMSQPCVARAASTAASSASITTFFFFFAPAAADAASRSNAAPTSAARMLRVAIPSGSIPSDGASSRDS